MVFPKFVLDVRVAALGLCALALAGYVPQAMASAAEKPALGYMLDMSRDKVPTMQSLYRMVDVLAVPGYDQFQLYGEHTLWTPSRMTGSRTACAGNCGHGVTNENLGIFQQKTRKTHL